MLTMEVQLVIRAPNQNIDDQVINCNTSWTIQKLKNHLSEVYPSRPAVQDQKLIYSGRLLLDHLQLKDIIRHEDMQSLVHILHLVCRRNNYSASPVETPSSSQDWSSQSLPGHSSGLSSENVETPSENVLRHRVNSPLHQMNDVQMQFQQMPVNTLPTFPGDPQMVAQMVAMQQMYAQYMAQYWQSINMSGGAGNFPFHPIAPSIQPLQSNPTNVLPENVAQQQANQRNNAPAVQPEDIEFDTRDWLDLLFMYFRFLILLCIVYFYATPERFMLVIIAIIIAFLKHEGWFVTREIAAAVFGQRNGGQADQNPLNNANDQPPINENDIMDGHELEAMMDGEDPPHAQNPDAANNNNNHGFSPLTFLTTFFSSLIPETPPPVNIN